MTAKSGTKEQCFEQLLLGKTVKSESWLAPIRDKAGARAQALNFPTAKQDDWRFTDLSPLFQHAFHPVDSYASVALADIDDFLIPGSIRLVFVDGCYASQLSDLKLADASVTVSSLAESYGVGRSGDAQVEANFAQHALFDQDTFAALNTRFFEDGAFVHVAGEAAAPIHLLNIATRRDTPSAIYPRCLIVMAANSRATVVEDYAGLNDGINFSNAVTEVVLKDHAQLQHVRVQREDKSAFHIGHCSVDAAGGSIYTSTALAFGARISRHELYVSLRGEGAEVRLNGLALIGGRQIADTHTRIDHATPRCISRQLHKCIADGSAHAIFSGKIMVQKGASGTDSEQSSRNLLLSGKAHIDTQPQLEIFNDDVSCKHGATIGQIDLDALFFLKSRGFNEARARNLLTHAFAAEIIDKIPVPVLVQSLERTILERVNGSRADGAEK
ncbi:MAG: Fe-S cluster assembly protein SufD [Gallionella sp.]